MLEQTFGENREKRARNGAEEFYVLLHDNSLRRMQCSNVKLDARTNVAQWSQSFTLQKDTHKQSNKLINSAKQDIERALTYVAFIKVFTDHNLIRSVKTLIKATYVRALSISCFAD